MRTFEEEIERCRRVVGKLTKTAPEDVDLNINYRAVVVREKRPTESGEVKEVEYKRRKWLAAVPGWCDYATGDTATKAVEELTNLAIANAKTAAQRAEEEARASRDIEAEVQRAAQS